MSAANSPVGSGNLFRYVIYAVIGVMALVLLCSAMLILAPGMSAREVVVNLDPVRTADVVHGQRIFTTSCATCHGPAGRGLPHQGAPLTGSRFLLTNNDVEIVRMIKAGRTQDDPKSVMHLPMPPKGGYAGLTDADLQDVTAYVKTFNAKAAR